MAGSTLVLGSGISGLATAYYLRRGGSPVTVLEASGQVGGKVTTLEVAGLPVDVGPDAFLSRGADLRQLIEDLGLTGDIVEPQTGGSYIWSRGKLRPIPPGAAFGLPDRLVPLLRSGLLSPLGVARAGFDIVLPATKTNDDPSIADLVRPRFGDDVYHRMVEPLLGGVHAGDPAQLSARSTVPEIYAIASGSRSVYLSMRKRPKPTGKRQAPLVSLRGGMGRLTQALAREVDVRLNTPATTLERTADGWRVNDLTADHVVLATPAYVTAELLRATAPELANELQIPYVDVANATLAFRPSDVPALPLGTGFLVPPIEREFIVGCSWLTNKWPHLVNDDVVLIKCMVGRAGDRRWLPMSDAEIVEGVRDGLARILGIDAEPQETLVQRWPRAMPQYVVGHAERLSRIDRLTPPGLHLTGAAYRGAGLAACTTGAVATATSIQGAPT
ncbi:MAG: protoporphyrinogen oxidase [Actinobacteria bacterium]|nr:protoporphyrinogen oxidase [Actinomycetota bacterium]HRY08979.1 protoporphyrinogen oxidase [Candidatus Nanopelagicales bacterium]